MRDHVRFGLALLSLSTLLVTTGCKRRPPLAERMAGSWRAGIEVGARASKDPLVRGWGKLWNREPLWITLEVGPSTLEVKRWSEAANAEVTQRASYRIVDDGHIELTTDQGPLRVGVDTGCADEGHCLDLRFTAELPDGAAPPPAMEALGFLFGCDDGKGNVRCAARAPRAFYRYVKPDAS